MDTLHKLQEIALRLDDLENSGDWLSQILSGSDIALAKMASAMSTLADDVRARLIELIAELERELELNVRLH